MSLKKLRDKVGCLENKVRNFADLFVVELGNLVNIISRIQIRPPIRWVPVTRSSEVKRLGTHLKLVSKLMRGVIPPLPPKVFLVWCLISEETTVASTKF